MTQSNRAVLQAIEYHLPEARVTNDALAEQFPEWTPARIHEIVGVATAPLFSVALSLFKTENK